MKAVEIRRDADLTLLREEWTELVNGCASRSIFLTWEWAAAWWAAYGTPGDLRILKFVDDSGVPRGIAPLRHQMVKRYGQTVPALAFLGDGSIAPPRLNDSDYLDFIITPGFEQAVMRAFQGHCASALQSGTVLLLNEIPESSACLSFLRAMNQELFYREAAVPCATVRLPENWEQYLSMLQSRFRTKVRSVLRNLESRPEVRFAYCTQPEELDRLLPALYDLHTRRWMEEGKPGVFGWELKRDFYSRLSRLLLEQGRLRLSWLEWSGRIMACQYGFTYGGTYSQLQEGYEPASEHLNLGVGLRAWSIRELLKEGVREYDFLGGVGRHKTTWGAEVKNSKRLLAARPSYRNMLFCYGPEWEQSARECIEKIVPGRVLEIRKKLLAPRSTGAGERIRQATAECYVRLALPAVTRPLRERYQLSIRNRGGKPSWSRRTEPAGRVLYYHRVNNDNDPFFEAISTTVFEQQMRYLARHYKLVSMRKMMRHLEDGNPRDLAVAVTFDDGYRDNYENAFPILQRYNIPATIFLTTGHLDSGEPMWFEQLAEALQKTTIECLDLEIDIPRRFWTRSLAERLQANAQIFAVLRKLSDEDRQHWLSEILRRLGAPATSARMNKMLTWDQVRIMNAHGVDFGGHTVKHPFLSTLTPSQAAWEVGVCKTRIEEELQKPVDYFAYPNGREEDFTSFSKQILREVGYQAAVTTMWGINNQATDRMALRRGGPWESNIALFASKLDWYQLVNG